MTMIQMAIVSYFLTQQFPFSSYSQASQLVKSTIQLALTSVIETLNVFKITCMHSTASITINMSHEHSVLVTSEWHITVTNNKIFF